MSPLDLYKQSDMVFYGQVISKQIGPGPDYYYYQVKVETYFKNQQTSDSITVTGHMPDPKVGYTQFEVGDKAIFYIDKIQGINTISPYSTKAGNECDIHAFLGPAPIQGEPIVRNPGVPLALLDENGSMVGSSLTNHPVFLTYDIGNNYPFSKNFTIEAFVEDQNDTSITFYKKQVLELGACESTGDALKWSFVPTKSGTYSLNVNIDGQFRLGYGFRVTDVNPASNQNSQVVSSPLKQFKSGGNALDVKCSTNYVLVIKAEDGSPACVKRNDTVNLMNQGWAINQFIVSIDYRYQGISVIERDSGYGKFENGTFSQTMVIYVFINNFTQSSYPLKVQVLHDDVPYRTDTISSTDILSDGFYKYQFTQYGAIFGGYKIIATYGNKTSQTSFGNPVPP